MRSPLTRISPAVGSISFRIALPAVDLPQPLSPTRPKVSPPAMSKEMPSTACTWPTVCCNNPFLTGKCLTRLRTDNRGGVFISDMLDGRRASFETAASRPPQDEELLLCHQRHASS